MEGHIDTSHAGVKKEDASILIESCGEARFSAVSNGEVVLVDTARLVMPERYSLEMRANYRHVIQLKGTGWALPVDAVGGEIEYVSTKVRWRSAHTRRAWLAGTIIEDMCAILDIDAIHRIVLADSVLDSSGCVPN